MKILSNQKLKTDKLLHYTLSLISTNNLPQLLFLCLQPCAQNYHHLKKKKNF